MQRHEIETKLKALRNNVANWVDPPRTLDPKLVLDLFHRYASIRDTLISEYPSSFNDLPMREIPEPIGVGTDNYDGRGYIDPDDAKSLLNDIDYCLDVLSSVTTVDIPSMKVTREGVFFAGQYFDALQLVKEIFSHAKKIIVIIDGYVDESVLNILTAKDSAVEVNILTKNVTPSFKASANAFNKQFGKLYIRESQAFHDRFVIIDDQDFYHFGASIKDLGNKGFMFSRIEEQIVINLLRKELAPEWAKAKVVM
jgi:hypothetical protein